MIHTPSGAKLALSILEGLGLYNGESAATTLRHATEAAQHADRLGFKRLWFTEHHNNKHQVSTSPDILSAHTAALTNHIRIGSGGVMLPNHAPLRVVENFSILEALHPGRIDLGMGRASGTDNITNAALRNNPQPLTGQDLTNQLLEVLAFFDREYPEDHPYSRIIPSPDATLRPDLFMLGSSDGGMHIASQLGLGFAFAGQINPGMAVPMLRTYRERFQPSRYLATPYSILSMIVVCAETDEEAEFLAGPAQLQWARWGTGQIHHAPPTLDEAANHRYTPAEEATRQSSVGRFAIGSPGRVKAQVERLAADGQIDELMAVSTIPDHEAQIRSHQLIAEVFELEPTSG